MKPLIAYAILNKRGGFLVYDGRLPIFWIKKIAKKHNQPFGGNVVKVKIEVLDNVKK
jgi:hypothetical protein